MYRRINEDNIWQITKVWTTYIIWWHNTLNSYLLSSQFTLNVNIHYSNFTLCIFIWKIKSKESILISSSFHLRLFYRQFFRVVLGSQQYWVESTESSYIFSFPVLLIFTLRLLHTFSMNSWSLGSRLGLRLDDLFTQLAKPWQESARKVLLANIACLWSNKKNRQYG